MSDRRYFVSVPNIVLDIALSENARRLYLRIKRDTGDSGGICRETITKLARDAKMGKSQAIEARDELATAHPELDGTALIVVRENGRVGNAITHTIEVVDIWPLNMARYAPKTPAPSPVLNGTEGQSHTEPAGPEWNREPVLNGTAYEELNPEELNHCDAATAAVAAPMLTTQSAHAVDVAPLGDARQPKTRQTREPKTGPNYGPLFAVVRSACKLGNGRMSGKDTRLVSIAARELEAIGISPDEATRAASRWASDDWRGQKGQPPTPPQFVTWATQCRADDAKSAPAPRSDPRGSFQAAALAAGVDPIDPTRWPDDFAARWADVAAQLGRVVQVAS